LAALLVILSWAGATPQVFLPELFRTQSGLSGSGLHNSISGKGQGSLFDFIVRRINDGHRENARNNPAYNPNIGTDSPVPRFTPKHAEKKEQPSDAIFLSTLPEVNNVEMYTTTTEITIESIIDATETKTTPTGILENMYNDVRNDTFSVSTVDPDSVKIERVEVKEDMPNLKDNSEIELRNVKKEPESLISVSDKVHNDKTKEESKDNVSHSNRIRKKNLPLINTEDKNHTKNIETTSDVSIITTSFTTLKPLETSTSLPSTTATNVDAEVELQKQVDFHKMQILQHQREQQRQLKMAEEQLKKQIEKQEQLQKTWMNDLSLGKLILHETTQRNVPLSEHVKDDKTETQTNKDLKDIKKIEEVEFEKTNQLSEKHAQTKNNVSLYENGSVVMVSGENEAMKKEHTLEEAVSDMSNNEETNNITFEKGNGFTDDHTDSQTLIQTEPYAKENIENATDNTPLNLVTSPQILSKVPANVFHALGKIETYLNTSFKNKSELKSIMKKFETIKNFVTI